MVRVDVLAQHDLVASGRTLSGNDGGRSKEEFPDSVPSDAILVNDLLLVTKPVSVPSPQGGRVVDTNVVDQHDLETGTFKFSNNKVQRSRSIGTWENVLVHEKTPDQVLELPVLTQTGVLQKEDTVIVQHVVNLRQERAELTDTNVLSHLQAGDLLVTTFWHRSVSVVTALNSQLGLWNTISGQSSHSVLGLVLTQGDTGHMGPVVIRSVGGQSTPATAKVQHGLTFLKADLLAHNLQLVVLQLLKSLFSSDVGDDTRSVDHARTKEPGVEVVTTVVVVSDLLFVLGTGVHDHFRNETKEEELEKRRGELESTPVMTVFKSIKTVKVEAHFVSEVQFVESLPRNLLSVVLGLKTLIMESDVVLNWLSRKLHFLVDPWREGGHKRPVSNENREEKKDSEEYIGLKPESKFTCDVKRCNKDGSKDDKVGERLRSWAVRWKWGIFDGRRLVRMRSQCYWQGNQRFFH